MSSDPMRDLADSLTKFADTWEQVVGSDIWLPGSAAEAECALEPLADEWSTRPARDAWIVAHHNAEAGLDHLRGLAVLLTSSRIVISLSTVARGALEAFAVTQHRTEPGTDTRERVRRSMNLRLASDHEARRMIANDTDPDAVDKRDGYAERMARIVRSGERQGFQPRRLHDPRNPPFLGSPVPSFMAMSDAAVSPTAGLGALYYRSLSAVAHSAAHGLNSHIVRFKPTEENAVGDKVAVVGISPRQAALHLLAAPMAAAGAVASLLWPCGWPQEPLAGALMQMLNTWGRVAGVPHPGQA